MNASSSLASIGASKDQGLPHLALQFLQQGSIRALSAFAPFALSLPEQLQGCRAAGTPEVTYFDDVCANQAAAWCHTSTVLLQI